MPGKMAPPGPALQETLQNEIQAYVYSLVSALGGHGADENGRYMLGDDALGCLKDLRRWLRLYDEKNNRLDVARCLAKANLVNGDLLEILSLWKEDSANEKYWSKLSLACLELLVPLTWPLEKNDQMTVNHHRHMPHLQEAQISYKRGILNYEEGRLLRTIVRIALPSMALPIEDRSHRDNGIIKLVLYFMRNIAAIAPSAVPQSIEDDHDVTRSATVEAFHYQDIFHLLLTISSSMGEDFDTEDIVILEILFHLLKGVDAERLLLPETQLDTRKADELRNLLHKEAGMLRSYAKDAPTRHNRFGTMIWIKRGDDCVASVSGQDVLMDPSRGLAKMDETKKWKKPRGKRKETESAQNDVDVPIALTPSASRHLKAFIEEFIDSSFNPFFRQVHKAIEREADRILPHHSRQFFFLISWFLKAERTRRKGAQSTQANRQPDDGLETSSFTLIANVLTQEIFITLNRFFQAAYDMHEWQDLKAGMRCFTQILLTVQEMAESPLEDDQAIAENILSRLFYEETTHERIVTIVRSYTNQDFGYLDACTELAHVHLRVLEHYSKQNLEMQVRSRRRVRRKKAKAAEARATAAGAVAGAANGEAAETHASEQEEVAEAQLASKERKFDFTRFAARFMTQACVDTFVALATYYRELAPEQLKRAHRFFYRVAFKAELSVLLFRIDIIALLHKMIKGPAGLDLGTPHGKEWSELVRQLFKKLVRLVQQRPELIVELLFSKIGSTLYFLEHGHVKPAPATRPRIPAELEIKPGFDIDRQIGIVVAFLLEKNEGRAIAWVKQALASAVQERQAWEAEIALRHPQDQEPGNPEEVPLPEAPSITIKPDTDERRKALFKNNKLRLLMKLVGFQPETDDGPDNTSWVIPPSVASSSLTMALESIQRYEAEPPPFEDGQKAEDSIRRKSAARPRRVEHSSDGEDSSGHEGYADGDAQFPAGGPTPRARAWADKDDREKRRRRRTGPLTDAEREARRKAREEANRRQQSKIKSNLYVHASDDESNEERDRIFFAKEEERRREQARKAAAVMRPELGKMAAAGGFSDDSEDSDSDAAAAAADNDNDGLARAPPSSGARARRKRRSGDDSDGEEDAGTVAAPQKRRKKLLRQGLNGGPVTKNGHTENDSDGAPGPQGDILSDDEELADAPQLLPGGARSIDPMAAMSMLESSFSQSSPLLPSSAGAAETTGDENGILSLNHLAYRDQEEEGADGEDIPIKPRRARTRGGFIIDSDSE